MNKRRPHCSIVSTRFCCNNENKMHWRKGEPVKVIKDYDELMLREKSLHLKEKELLKKEIILQRKVKEFNKRAERRAKLDLSTAADLQEARRKLLFVLESKQKAQKRKKHNSKNKQKNVPSLRTRYVNGKKDFNDILYDFCEKLLTSPCTKNNTFNTILDTKFRPYSSRYAKMLGLNRHECMRNIPYMERNLNSAENCYLMSLRKTPQTWIYSRWPKFYPHYKSCQKQWKNLGYVMLFFLGFLLWAPILIYFELVKCCFCACCYDC